MCDRRGHAGPSLGTALFATRAGRITSKFAVCDGFGGTADGFITLFAVRTRRITSKSAVCDDFGGTADGFVTLFAVRAGRITSKLAVCDGFGGTANGFVTLFAVRARRITSKTAVCDGFGGTAAARRRREPYPLKFVFSRFSRYCGSAAARAVPTKIHFRPV